MIATAPAPRHVQCEFPKVIVLLLADVVQVEADAGVSGLLSLGSFVLGMKEGTHGMCTSCGEEKRRLGPPNTPQTLMELHC
jgi:hypothetical protein